jgi:hypothetical protein
MARIVTDSHPDFVRAILFIPAVELLGIQDQIFINSDATEIWLYSISSSRLSAPFLFKQSDTDFDQDAIKAEQFMLKSKRVFS